MVAVKEVYDSTIQGTDRPLIIFNGELDRIRSGYYPSVFYPGLAKMAKEWLPQFCTAFYIHNFKGRNPGEQHPHTRKRVLLLYGKMRNVWEVASPL